MVTSTLFAATGLTKAEHEKTKILRNLFLGCNTSARVSMIMNEKQPTRLKSAYKHTQINMQRRAKPPQ